MYLVEGLETYNLELMIYRDRAQVRFGPGRLLSNTATANTATTKSQDSVQQRDYFPDGRVCHLA